MIAAIFDLDGTLLSGMTGSMFINYLRRSGQLSRYFSPRAMFEVVAAGLAHKVRLLNATQAMQITVAASKGLELEAMWDLVHRWFEEMVVHTITPGGRKQLAWHQAQGHIPVICTASSQFSAAPVAAHLGIEHFLFSEWLSQDGRMTGAVRLPIMYGTGKVFWLRRWADAQGVDLHQSYFYTDHHSDLPLLDLVAHPAVVHPNRSLHAVAAARGWPILDWSRT